MLLLNSGGNDLLQYKGRAFRVATFDHWLVIVSGPKLIDDIRRAADDELSFDEAANEVRHMWLRRLVHP